MNYSKKSKVTIIFSAVLLGLFIIASVYLGPGGGSNNYNLKNLFMGSNKDDITSLFTSTEVVEPKDSNRVKYNLEEISKYKTAYIGDFSKVYAIVNQLLIPDSNYIQRYMSLDTEKTPYGLTVFYETKEEKQGFSQFIANSSKGDFNCILNKNALVLFSMIDNVDIITFSFSDSPYPGELDRTKYCCEVMFSREQTLKNHYNFDLIKDNIDLLRDALDGIKNNYTISKLES